MQLQDVDPKARQDKLTRPSWNARFDKERDGQVAECKEKLTQHQAITNSVSRQSSWI
jgi:hypothetical protein